MKPARLLLGLALLAVVLLLTVALHGPFGSAPTPPPRSVAVQVPGRLEAPTPAPTPASAPEPEKPPRTIRIRGRLTDAAGNALPFVRIDGFDRSLRGTLTRIDAESDAGGAFQVDGPEQSRATFTAHLPGHGRAFATVAFGDPDRPVGQQTDLSISLRRATAFDGILTAKNGAPVAGATLTFHPFSTRYGDEKLGIIGMNVLLGTAPADEAWDRRCRQELFLTDARAVSDGRGRFRAESLTAGVTYLIAVEREGSPRVVLEAHVRGQKEPAALQLPD